MRLFENDAQLADALRVLSEAGLIDIVVAGSNREPGYRLSDAITKPRAQGGDPVRADPDGSRRARRSGA